MVLRFCLYSILKNLRFFEPFFVLYLLSGPELGGPGLNYFQIGGLVGYQKLLTGLLEVPSGVATDRWGRRSALALCFGCYVLAFPSFAIAAGLAEGSQVLALYAAQTLFAIGEALRTGSHKAIMLDWADRAGRGDDVVRIIGITRFFSKSSAGLSALVGGAWVYWSGSFVGLFWAATLPAVGGLALMLSYPRWLEGEQRRAGGADRPSWGTQLRRLWAAPGLLFLMLQSVLLESQIKLVQHYIQPFLKSGFDARELVVAGGVGALFVGAYYLVQDFFGGAAAIAAPPVERRLGGGLRALNVFYLAAAAVSALIALSLGAGWLWAGVLGFVLIAGMQNARRPIFVAQFNRVMDKPQRATTLSIESQARGWMVAVLAPLSGWVADHHGLAAALFTIAGTLVLGFALQLLPKGGLGDETGAGA